MNREIKFRGLCFKSKAMVYGDLIHGVGGKYGNVYILPKTVNLVYIKHCDPLDGVRVIPESVGQYIGSKDIKEKETYKGDILKAPSGRLFVVGWHEEEMRWAMKSKDTWYNMNMGLHEVIGNIFENPELLSNEQK